MRIIFLGGNGHCAARLWPARAVVDREAAALEIVEARYPGFEGRPTAGGLAPFLDALSAEVGAAARGAAARGAAAGPCIYATGIGGLFALCLRARGEILDVPILLQGPVLWGLERRLMPRLLRLPLARRALPTAFASPTFQARFARKRFTKPPPAELERAFFDGYAQCAALSDLFVWLTPALLRELEAAFAERPGALSRIAVWWGGLDTVVPTQELQWTEEALQVRWPIMVFNDWGHYPMIDDPEGWVRALLRPQLGAWAGWSD